MLGLLALHISALLLWVASLVYLPILILRSHERPLELTPSLQRHDSVARYVFTQIASPAGLLAIVAGTGVFAINGTTTLWLIIKLGLVTLLVAGHVSMGLLVMRQEERADKPLQPWCWVLLVYCCGLAAAIVWLVLAKPAWGGSL